MNIALSACLTIAVLCAPARAASFDCARAATPDETAVCADPQLSELDSLLGQAHKAALGRLDSPAGPADLKATERRFLAARNVCGAERACLLVRYVEVLGDLQGLGSSVDSPRSISALDIAAYTAPGGAPESNSLPTRQGQCVTTRISEIGPRLESDTTPTDPAYFAGGVSVIFANKGYQVSYEPDQAVIRSRPGDKVVMCLIAFPHLCPKGDDRGIAYMTTNLRTHGTWTMTDSQHSCGGA